MLLYCQCLYPLSFGLSEFILPRFTTPKFTSRKFILSQFTLVELGVVNPDNIKLRVVNPGITSFKDVM